VKLPDLSFVADDMHRRLLRELLDELLRDEEVIGVLLTGSLARGDALPGSDVDLQVILADGLPRSFSSGIREGIMVEKKSADYEDTLDRLSRRPMEVYSYLDGCILHDPEGKLEKLRSAARDRFAAYRTPDEEKRGAIHWIKSALIKLEAARRASDDLKAAYVASTTSWPLLEGLWAANDWPVPPNSSVWPHLNDLTNDPAPLEEWLKQLFLGSVDERTEAASVLMRRIVERLESGERPAAGQE
jgi:predicted nucleotidyltransferase